MPALYRYRSQMLVLDSIQALTRGSAFDPLSLALQLDWMRGLYTGVYVEDGHVHMIAQIHNIVEQHTAHLTFLTPAKTANTIALPSLLEHLGVKSGEMGAMNLVGEVEELAPAYQAMRRAGFSTYSWQRIWSFPGTAACPEPASRSTPAESGSAGTWQRWESTDGIATRNLYSAVVPALLQPIKPFITRYPHRLVYREKGELLAYADLVYGPQGIWIQPMVSPVAEQASCLLVDLLTQLPHRAARTVYICVRSYQAWLESSLEDLSAEVGPRQALLVKRLAIAQKVTSELPVAALERTQVKTSSTIARVKRSS